MKTKSLILLLFLSLLFQQNLYSENPSSTKNEKRWKFGIDSLTQFLSDHPLLVIAAGGAILFLRRAFEKTPKVPPNTPPQTTLSALSLIPSQMQPDLETAPPHFFDEDSDSDSDCMPAAMHAGLLIPATGLPRLSAELIDREHSNESLLLMHDHFVETIPLYRQLVQDLVTEQGPRSIRIVWQAEAHSHRHQITDYIQFGVSSNWDPRQRQVRIPNSLLHRQIVEMSHGLLTALFETRIRAVNRRAFEGYYEDSELGQNLRRQFAIEQTVGPREAFALERLHIAAQIHRIHNAISFHTDEEQQDIVAMVRSAFGYNPQIFFELYERLREPGVRQILHIGPNGEGGGYLSAAPVPPRLRALHQQMLAASLFYQRLIADLTDLQPDFQISSLFPADSGELSDSVLAHWLVRALIGRLREVLEIRLSQRPIGLITVEQYINRRLLAEAFVRRLRNMVTAELHLRIDGPEGFFITAPLEHQISPGEMEVLRNQYESDYMNLSCVR